MSDDRLRRLENEVRNLQRRLALRDRGLQVVPGKISAKHNLSIVSLSGAGFKDEDNMASDSATAAASQQSIKAYVDSEVIADHGGLSGLGDYDHPQYVRKDSWVDDDNTWVYASANSFTVGDSYSDLFGLGTKVRYKQGGAYKYGYVESISQSMGTTTVTLISNSDYSLANAVITDNYYSNSSPPDFPTVLNYTPTWTAATANPAIGSGDLIGMFAIIDRMVHYTVVIKAASDTTFGIGAWEVGLPVDAGAYSDSLFRWLGRGWARDNSGDDNYDVMPAVARFASGIGLGRMIVPGTGVESLNASTPFTWDEDDSLVLSGCYPV